VLGAPWPALYEGLSSSLGVLAATAIPHVGAALKEHKTHRLLVEPGVVASNRDVFGGSLGFTYF
jgi:hypothetical protein